jgi:hypothetical protein
MPYWMARCNVYVVSSHFDTKIYLRLNETGWAGHVMRVRGPLKTQVHAGGTDHFDFGQDNHIDLRINSRFAQAFKYRTTTGQWLDTSTWSEPRSLNGHLVILVHTHSEGCWDQNVEISDSASTAADKGI